MPTLEPASSAATTNSCRESPLACTSSLASPVALAAASFADLAFIS